MDEPKMMCVEDLVKWMITLESKYYELQSKYQTLIHQYEELKASHESCTGHRNELGSRYDLSRSDQKP
jgi:hypothetical protein